LSRWLRPCANISGMTHTQRLRLTILGVLLCLLVPFTQAQPKGKKSYTFRGKVEKVDTTTKRLTVAGEKVEGWMDAMTMGYSVDKADEVVKVVKAGDQITATVYEGDSMLYNVQVVPKK
jgi:Cu/Ag efflux protein CusF